MRSFAQIWFTQAELDLFKANMIAYKKLVRLHIAARRTPTAGNILGMEKFLSVQLTEEYLFRRGKLADEVVDEARRQRFLASRGGALHDESADSLARIAAENGKWAREGRGVVLGAGSGGGEWTRV